MLAAPPSTRSSALFPSGKKNISPTERFGPTANCRRHRRMTRLLQHPSQPRRLGNLHPNIPMLPTSRRANFSRQARALLFLGLCRGALQRDRLLFFVFICCISIFAIRAVKAQDQPGPTQPPPPPPQQTDRPPWARKN